MPRYEPKVLYNPKPETVEFMCGGLTYIFKPGEKRNLDGFPAHHALKEVNTGLVEYEGQPSRVSGVDYRAMKWRRLVALASAEGIRLKKGMDREKLVKALEEIDAKETGAVPESAAEEAEEGA
jgi:hypothetical protein